MTPFFLGVVAGSIVLHPELSGPGSTPGSTMDSVQSFEIYLRPWCNSFCFAVGIFTCALFSFLAAVYLVGETSNLKFKREFIRWARFSNVIAVIAGGGVFFSAYFGETEGQAFLSRFIYDPLALGCMGMATAILAPLWVSLIHENALFGRILAAGQVVLILLGWIWIQYPRLVGSWTIYNSAAPRPTLFYLLAALGGGALLIFPSLFYLLHLFKRTENSA
jgi:cytochrome d ubiquinol oxidase subunit II